MAHLTLTGSRVKQPCKLTTMSNQAAGQTHCSSSLKAAVAECARVESMVQHSLLSFPPQDDIIYILISMAVKKSDS